MNKTLNLYFKHTLTIVRSNVKTLATQKKE